MSKYLLILCLISLSIFAKRAVIQGKITDKSGCLSLVSIIVKNSQIGTSTALNGAFRFENPSIKTFISKKNAFILIE